MNGAAADLTVARQFDRPGILFRLALASSERLFLGAADGKVHDLDLAPDPPAAKAYDGHTGYVMGLVLASGWLVSGAYDGKLIWRSPETGEETRRVEAHSRWIRNLRASPDGGLFASVADDMVCRLWNAQSGELVRELAGHDPVTPHHFPSMLYDCEFSPDGRYLATGDKIGKVVIWDVASGERAGDIEAPGLYTWDPVQRIHSIGGIRSLAFSPDGSLLAVGGIGAIGNIDHLDAPARIEVFDWRTGERKLELAAKHKGLAERLSFSLDGASLLVAGGDHGGFLEQFQLSDGKSLFDAKAPMHIHDLAWTPSRDALVTVGHGKVAIWRQQQATSS